MATPNAKLEAARMQRRWSVAVASEKAGVSINTFNRWERGLQVPQLGTLDQACRAFGLSPEELGFENAIRAKRRATATAKPPPLSCPASINHPSTNQPSSNTAYTPTIVVCQQPAYELQTCLEQARRSLEGMKITYSKGGDEGVSRRQAIVALISTPAVVFGLTQSASSAALRPQEALALCEAAIPLSWRLYFEGGLVEVGQILPGYLSQLMALAQHPSQHQQKAARLTSQANQLSSLLSLQYQNFGTALTYARQAFEYGTLAADPNLQTASLIRQAQVYFYLKHPQQRLQAFEQALLYSNQSTDLLRGRVYIGLSEVHGELGHQRQAQYFQDLAHATFPKQCEDDPNFYYTHFNAWSFCGFEGLMYLNLHHPNKAWEEFEQADKNVPRAPVPNRVELHVRQASAALAMGDLDQSCIYVGRAVTSALQAGNQLRYDEAYDIYEKMLARWGKEPRLKELADIFVAR
ncbi:XRE family transcriptional regulator [Ktedonosporobacter rubrisoli]|uniref:XRE family transcriptional regulator n=1 Tax=Ktedonosporobacter rubrisoli TaxID=2509675 RepID=A0A4P6K0N9_KTERU|nr:helix-turn-helix transcriptional regulator [Ktedonosporobacter rubrisoli]QBD81535.1 XRE family transcriptional regulator [Ktedonosporobacter rubrisoli]